MINQYDVQVGGNHYKNFEYQPHEFILDIQAGGSSMAILKYLSRDKFDVIEDYKKAYHFICLDKQYIGSNVSDHLKIIFPIGYYSDYSINYYKLMGRYFNQLVDGDYKKKIFYSYLNFKTRSAKCLLTRLINKTKRELSNENI